MTQQGADLVFDLAMVDAASDRLARAYLSAGTRTVGVVTRRAEQRLEDLTRRAAGGRLWRAWQSSVFPRGNKPARDPVGEIWVKGRARTDGAIKFWTEPGRVTSRNGGWLPIPLEGAGIRNRQGLIGPREWEEAHPMWRLNLLWQDGKRPLLVARPREKRRPGVYGAPRRQGGITDGQPIFALVRDNPFRNAVAIAPVLRQAEAEMAGEYAAQARKIGAGGRP